MSSTTSACGQHSSRSRRVCSMLALCGLVCAAGGLAICLSLLAERAAVVWDMLWVFGQPWGVVGCRSVTLVPL